MQTLDIVLIVLFIPGIIRGLTKGFLEQAISLAGVFLSVWASFHFSALVCTWIRPYLPAVSDTVLGVVSFSLILIAVLIGALLLAKLLTKVAEMALLGWVNRVLGVVSAILVSALVISVGIILFDTLNVRFAFVDEKILRQSVLYSPIKDLGYYVFPYLKEFLLKQ